MTSTREVYDEHVRALTSADIEAVAAGYARDAVMIANGEVYEGRDAISALFAANDGSRLLDADSGLRTRVTEVRDTIFVAWSAGSGAEPSIYGTDTFVIIDGLITRHTGFNTSARQVSPE